MIAFPNLRSEKSRKWFSLRSFNFLENSEIPATFAFRGQLADTDDSLIELVKQSSIKHEIGAHGYYHRCFTSLSHSEAERELRMISAGIEKIWPATEELCLS